MNKNNPKLKKLNGSSGTNLDEIGDYKHVPAQYVAMTFIEALHTDVDAFYEMSNDDKFKMAFWAEMQTMRKSLRYGFFTGIVFSIFFIYIIFQIIS